MSLPNGLIKVRCRWGSASHKEPTQAPTANWNSCQTQNGCHQPTLFPCYPLNIILVTDYRSQVTNQSNWGVREEVSLAPGETIEETLVMQPVNFEANQKVAKLVAVLCPPTSSRWQVLYHMWFHSKVTVWSHPLPPPHLKGAPMVVHTHIPICKRIWLKTLVP
jgi:hypothetical protein